MLEHFTNGLLQDGGDEVEAAGCSAAWVWGPLGCGKSAALAAVAQVLIMPVGDIVLHQACWCDLTVLSLCDLIELRDIQIECMPVLLSPTYPSVCVLKDAAQSVTHQAGQAGLRLPFQRTITSFFASASRAG